MNAATTETSDTFADDWCGKSKENDGNGGEDTHEGYFQVFRVLGIGSVILDELRDICSSRKESEGSQQPCASHPCNINSVKIGEEWS